MKTRLLLIVCSLLVTSVFAQQQFTINGTIHAGDETASYATVQLLPASVTTLSNDNGYFRFVKLTPGQYIIKVSVPGYADYEDSVTLSNKNLSLDIILVTAGATT